ncbi:hypothetical protein EV356DRAFT_29327 [Viridothelium virens]|uniref:Uncharacterized protein n=1 Tax=Viridothelium virens TaxID=1048519 RepID=A0A6A6HGI5_VIRVR|nr:hypothetical protein EV356DRAFT_29327 [Viridothelium virens]
MEPNLFACDLAVDPIQHNSKVLSVCFLFVNLTIKLTLVFLHHRLESASVSYAVETTSFISLLRELLMVFL